MSTSLLAEESVLGSILLDNTCLDYAVTVITPEYFDDDKLRRIYSACLSLHGGAVDLITVSDQLRKDGNLDYVGGIPFLSDLVASIATAAHIKDHVEILVEHYNHRRMVTLNKQIDKALFSGGDSNHLIKEMAKVNSGKDGHKRKHAQTASARPLLLEKISHDGLTKALADLITEQDHFATDTCGDLFVYQNGVYVSGGDEHIRGRIREILVNNNQAKKWKKNENAEVIEYTRIGAKKLWSQPPTTKVNLLNGIYDLEKMELLPHTPEYFSSVQLPITFDPSALCPTWDNFIATSFPEDAPNSAFEILGYLMTPCKAAQKAFLVLGPGGNGKSTFLKGLSAFLGNKNIEHKSPHDLETSRFASYYLHGKLANMCADMSATKLESSSLFKQLVGDDPISYERKHGAAGSFKPFCRLVFSSNYPPRSNDASQAFFRRWLVIPFDRDIPPEKLIDSEKLDKALAQPGELSGVFNRAVAAYDQLRKNAWKFSEPQSVREAFKDFCDSTDPLALWFSQYVAEGSTYWVTREDLLGACNGYRMRHGLPVMTAKAFTIFLRRHKPNVGQVQRNFTSGKKYVWTGIGLKNESHDIACPDIPNIFYSLDENINNDKTVSVGSSWKNVSNPVPLPLAKFERDKNGLCHACGSSPEIAPGEWAHCPKCHPLPKVLEGTVL